MAGRRSVWALKLADGSPAWDGRHRSVRRREALPAAPVSCSGSQYYLPSEHAEVVAIDLDAGRAAHSYKSRRGIVPGNLVCSRRPGRSQRAGRWTCSTNSTPCERTWIGGWLPGPDDPEALTQRGEILWDEGKLKEAIGCFRRAMDLTPSPNTRDLLRDALFEGLRSDFAATVAKAKRSACCWTIGSRGRLPAALGDRASGGR